MIALGMVLTVRSGKGDRDRRAILPATLKAALAERIRHSLDQAQPGPGARGGLGRAALGPRSQVPERRPHARLAVGLSGHVDLPRARVGRAPPPPLARDGRTEGGPRSRAPGRDPQARHLSHPEALVRDTPAGGRSGHPHDPGAARPQGRLDDDDLHARAESGADGGQEPCGPVGGALSAGGGRALIDRQTLPALRRPV